MKKPKRSLRNNTTVMVLAVAVAAVFTLATLLLEAFKTPSGSMYPTLQVGDHLYVTTATYGFFSKRLAGRGEIVAFEEPYPRGRDAEKFIKRVLAVAGDTVAFDAGHPTINGWPVPRCELGSAAMIGVTNDGHEGDFFVEFLAGHAYLTVYDSDRDGATMSGSFEVPAGEVFVVGDNRYNSSDSRTFRGGKPGGLPASNVVGRASFLWLPVSRLGTSLHGEPLLPEGVSALQPALDKCLRAAPPAEQTVPPSRR